MSPPERPRCITLDPDSCPAHARVLGDIEDLRESERSHEHRITVMEIEGSSRMKAASALAPIVVALIAAVVSLYVATRKAPQWSDTHSSTAPNAYQSSSASRP